jgi:U6 snRNA-associated Sm-like protein LSm1
VTSSVPLKDLDQEDDVPLRQVEWGMLEPYHKREAESKRVRDDRKAEVLFEQKGFCKEGGEGDGY